MGDARKCKIYAPTAPHTVTWRDYVAMYLWLGWLNFYLGVLSVLVLLMFTGQTGAAVRYVLAPLAALTLVPRGIPGGQALGKWIMERARNYFHLTVVHEDEAAIAAAAAAGPVVIALEPHDVLPFSIFAFSRYLSLVPGRRAVGLMTGAVFWLPGMKQVYHAVSAGSVSKANFVAELKRGASVTLVPGGVQEVLALEPRERDAGRVNLYLARRRGFLKLALDANAAVVPAYCFGLEETYSAWWPSGPRVAVIARRLGFLPMYYHGVPAYAPLGVPRPVPLTVVVGAPVPPPPLDAADRVGAFHDAFCAALLALVRRHRGARSQFGEGLRVAIL